MVAFCRMRNLTIQTINFVVAKKNTFTILKMMQRKDFLDEDRPLIGLENYQVFLGKISSNNDFILIFVLSF